MKTLEDMTECGEVVTGHMCGAGGCASVTNHEWDAMTAAIEAERLALPDQLIPSLTDETFWNRVYQRFDTELARLREQGRETVTADARRKTFGIVRD
jgi:hypothetical protein